MNRAPCSARKWSAKADHRPKAQSGVRARRRLALSIGTPGGEPHRFEVAVKEVAQEFALDEQELIRQSLRAFLLERLRLLDAERRAKCAKFGVTTLEEMDDLLKTGQVEEEDILEDFQHVDYLTTQAQRIQQLLEETEDA